MKENQCPKEFGELIKLAQWLGATNAGVISTGDICVEDRLAELCKEPQCENYGQSSSCPPHVSGPSGFRELLKNYRQAVVFKIDVPSEVLFSSGREEVFRLLHEVAAGIEQSAIRMGYSKSKAYAGGSCKRLFCQDHPRCQKLSEGGECRNPAYARPSMSGFGINVSKLLQAAGWPVNRSPGGTLSPGDSMSTVCGLVLIG